MTRARLAMALAALTAALLVSQPAWVAALALPALPKLLRARAGRRQLAQRLRACAPLVAAVAIAAAWSAAVSGKAGALAGGERALLLGVRVVAATIWSSWLTYGLGARELEAGLRALGLPAAFIALLSATRRFGRQLAATSEAAWAASTLRGGSLSLRALGRTLGAVAGVVVVRSLDRSEQVAIAEALRGAGPVSAGRGALPDNVAARRALLAGDAATLPRVVPPPGAAK